MRRHLQLGHQSSDNVIFESPSKRYVVDADVGVVGGEALDASDTLLDNHWIPGKVIVYQHIRDLKIDAFGTGFRGNDYSIDGRSPSKPLDRFLIAFSRVAVDDSDFQPVAFKKVLYCGLCLTANCEDN